MEEERHFTEEFGFIHGWKAIGAVLGKSARTARRWYDTRGLPVRHGINDRPFAIRWELVRWMELVHKIRWEGNPAVRKRYREHAAMMRSMKKKNRGGGEHE
jgi:hypothetical protein